jgi:ABC-type nickel/cobalt efflux system permease component RcnA
VGRLRGLAPHQRRRLFAILLGVAAVLVLPGLTIAHPLGNFTINHYAGIRVEPDAIRLDVVNDQAEIPAFQARQALDTDGDGTVSPTETEAARVAACTDLTPSLDLQVDGVRRVPTLDAAGLRFPPGAGGLVTMRLVCGYIVPLVSALDEGTIIAFTDTSFAKRIGWREIVVQASGLTVAANGDAALRGTSASARLTTYPADLLTQPLADAAVTIRVTGLGGPTLAAFDIPDASPLTDAATGEAAPTAESPASASVPGGVTLGELPSIFRTEDLTPWVLLLSILTAAALGVGHALTPGHGKTLMAAYLVGTRGTAVHAVGLGLSVSLSHTMGILALTAVIVAAQGVLAPDVVVRSAPMVAAVSIVAIGGWMLLSEIRRRRAAAPALADDDGHDHPHEHPHEHEHAQSDAGVHSHGGVSHTHLPTPGTAITWRSLFVLGLAGGLIPSTSALLILLGSIAAGRPAFGFVLVVAFGLGMALVMGGIGVALVVARGRLDRVDARSTLGRFGAAVPLVAAVLVFGLGIYLTVQAVSGTPVL